MTNKTRKTILITSFVLVELFYVGAWYYIFIARHLEDRLVWIYTIGMIVLLLGMMYLLPYLLRMDVTNGHHAIMRNERLVFNGKDRVWEPILWVIAGLVLGFIMLYTYAESEGAIRIRSIYYALACTGIFAIGLSPIYGDIIYRAYKNTYTIEGENLIIDEWAWFRRKTDHLTIPISEIEHIRKRNVGVMQGSNIIMTVAGIKRTLVCGMIGDEIYDALKERMA